MDVLKPLAAFIETRTKTIREDLDSASKNKNLAEEVASRYRFQNIVLQDPKSALTKSDLDIFWNAGPNKAHTEATRIAAQAGAHVFCEKPLAPTSDEALDLLINIQKTDVKHMCAFIHRFIPSLLSNAYIDLFAKYVNEFNHSILAPLVAVNASTPGVINVAE